MSSDLTGVSGLAGRYATALFELAEAQKSLDTVAEDLAQLARLIEESGDFARLLRSPVISREDQQRAMAAVLDKAGMSELTHRFIGVVAQHRRLFALPRIIRAYRALLAQRRGEVTAEVVSAKVLSDDQLRDLTDALKGVAGTRVSVEARVDPGLLGGLVVKVGSRMIDDSLRTKLENLRLAMKGTG